MDKKFDVILTQKRFLKPNKILKGKILEEYTKEIPDWMGLDYEEKHTIIKLENENTIEIIDYGYGPLGGYSFEKI